MRQTPVDQLVKLKIFLCEMGRAFARQRPSPVVRVQGEGVDLGTSIESDSCGGEEDEEREKKKKKRRRGEKARARHGFSLIVAVRDFMDLDEWNERGE